MTEEDIVTIPPIPKKMDREYKRQFSDALKEITWKIGFKISARGWCYQLEQYGMVNKAQFDKVESIINTCRKEGYLPIDFVAQEEARGFSGVEIAEDRTIPQYLKGFIKAVLRGGHGYIPNWWEDEECYIQMVVEKIDLVSLFSPICEEYKIPIATSKGWSSMLQRAEYSRRFKEAEKDGLQCVLLYCGDHDPDGQRIDQFLRKNLEDVANIHWEDGEEGYDPSNLTIDRFGLKFDFIEEHGFTWIDNLITGSGKNLASPTHKNNKMEYVQTYLRDVGERKCEANALVVRPEIARQLCVEAIEKYLGVDASKRFRDKRRKVMADFDEFREKVGLKEPLEKVLKMIEDEEDVS